MDKVKREVVRFLRKYQMDYLDVDFDENLKAFLKEMSLGLAGKKSSLVMIPTYIETGAEVPSNKRAIVVDAGGTNFRVATVYFDEQKRPVIENLKLFKMPGTGQEVGKDEFFRIMACYLKDVAAISDHIGFCFSYAVDMQPNKDGRLIRFSKEVKASAVIGQLIGENLNKALSASGLGVDKHIVLLNDTVVTLLAGCGYKNRTFGSYVGFILGTGTNCCYIEQNSRIKKNKSLDASRNMIINSESGGFGKCHRGRLDVSFDKTTANPGAQKLEKMISGAYLGPLSLHVMKKACRDKLLSPAAGQAVMQITELDTKDLNYFMLYPFGDNLLANACKNGTSDDTLALCYLADRMVERAAKLTAINLSAMAVKCGQGTDPTRPVCIVAEGTTFYQMKTLKPRVEFYLKQHLEDKRGIYTEIISVDNATLIGSAIAGLTN
ncbi:MAG: hexokinase [Planctomycetes bacterium]|nr:hexokinase [Planctomycetota bacterium]